MSANSGTHIYRTQIDVRGHELDSFRHVNHAVYFSYLEHARWKLFEDINISLETLDRWKKWPIIARVEGQYLKPTYLNDRLDIETRLLERGKTSFVFVQEITRKGQPVFRGKVTVVMIDERGRPSAAPEELIKAVESGKPVSRQSSLP